MYKILSCKHQYTRYVIYIVAYTYTIKCSYTQYIYTQATLSTHSVIINIGNESGDGWGKHCNMILDHRPKGCPKKRDHALPSHVQWKFLPHSSIFGKDFWAHAAFWYKLFWGHPACWIGPNHFSPFYIYACNLFMESTIVHFQAISWGKGLVTMLTGKRYSFQVVGLNVVSYLVYKAFLTTHFANGWGFLVWCSICLFTSWNHPLTFVHHWLDLFIQCLQIGRTL